MSKVQEVRREVIGLFEEKKRKLQERVEGYTTLVLSLMKAVAQQERAMPPTIIVELTPSPPEGMLGVSTKPMLYSQKETKSLYNNKEAADSEALKLMIEIFNNEPGYDARIKISKDGYGDSHTSYVVKMKLIDDKEGKA